jgi:adenine-specific DNA methylase
MTSCPRLIEVALPIRKISAESVRDKSLRHGHISTLHLWWARRPLPAARGIVFASLVPDPDDPQCPAEFRKAVERLLRDKLPSALRAYRRGRDWIAITEFSLASLLGFAEQPSHRHFQTACDCRDFVVHQVARSALDA